jgi:hypothetical protein
MFTDTKVLSACAVDDLVQYERGITALEHQLAALARGIGNGRD